MFFAHDQDPVSAELAGVRPRARAEFDAHWERILADDSVVERAIVADGQLAGRIACFEIGTHKTVGYWIARERWGRGIATRALGLLVAEVTDRPLFAQVRAENGASIRVLERNGFRAIATTDEPGTERYTAGRVVRYRLD